MTAPRAKGKSASAPRGEGTLILGRGKVGRALASALRTRGLHVQLAGARTVPIAALRAASFVVLAVPDAAISAAATRIAGVVPRGAVVVHCAGRLGMEPLLTCKQHGAAIGVMHPLVSFASRRTSPALVGATFVLAGDARATRASRQLVMQLGAHALVAPIHGSAYHASAALLAGGAVALVSQSTAVLVALGLAPSAARRALAGLLGSVASNLEQLDAPSALTGPIARGDATAVAAHRVALAQCSPETLALYDAIAPAVLAVAVRAGLDEVRAKQVRREISRAIPGTRRRRATAR